MQPHPLTQYFPTASRLIYGCMGLGGAWDDQALTSDAIATAHQAVDAALEAGITVFDHADIYTQGKAESSFGEILKQRPALREDVIIQTKCGIRFADDQGPQRFDFSADWITHSVHQSLQRLHTDHIDVFLLHRPDPLLEPEVIASTFERLQKAGKVKYFGVSNMSGHQIDFLQAYLDTPLVANQIEMSLTALDWVDHGVDHNTARGSANQFVPGTLEYCRRNGVQLQSWGGMSQGLFSGRDVSDQPAHIQATAALVHTLAKRYEVSREAIVLGWLLRHPAGIQPVIGTTHPGRIQACAQAKGLTLSREDWYALLVAARGESLP